MGARRPVALASVLLALALTVSACTSDPPPAAAPPNGTAAPVTPSTPASPTTTSAPPTTTQAPVDPVLAKIPKAARANTQEGAEAFAKFCIEQVAQSGVKADPRLLDGLFIESCKACLAYRESAVALKSDGLHHKSPTLQVKRSSANVFSGDQVVISVEVLQRAVPVVNDSGVTVRKTKANTGVFALSLSYEGRWVVRQSQVEAYR
jgi:hypothetical protein